MCALETNNQFTSISFDTSRCVGSVDGKSLYLIDGCHRHCLTKDGDIYTISKNGVDFEPTSYIYIPTIQTYSPRVFVGGVVVDLNLHYIGGNVFRRFHHNGIRTETINGVEYNVYGVNFIEYDSELEHFSRENGISKDSNSGFFIKYNGYVGFYDEVREVLTVEHSFSSKENPPTLEERLGVRDAEEKMGFIVAQKMQLFIDSSSFINILDKDAVLCFRDMESIIMQDNESFNTVLAGKTLGLSRGTLLKIKKKALEDRDTKAIEKLSFYKTVYAYMVSTISNKRRAK